MQKRRKAGGMLSNLVVCYLFLGGAGGGACAVLAVLGLLSPRDEIAVLCPPSSGGAAMARSNAGMRVSLVAVSPVIWRFAPAKEYRRLFAAGHAASLIALFLGAICLVADLARSDRVALLFISPTPTLITLGTWLLTATMTLTCVLLFLWGSNVSVRFILVRSLQAIALVAGLGVTLYTGLLLQGITAVPLWSTPWLPTVFVISAVSCGIALIVLASCLTGAALAFDGVLRRLLNVDAVLLALEAIAMALLVLVSLQGNAPANAAQGLVFAATPTDEAAIVSAGTLVYGSDAWLFWLGFAVVGLAVPFVLECASRSGFHTGMELACAASCCVLIGGFVMRYCIVAAGIQPMAVSAAAVLM